MILQGKKKKKGKTEEEVGSNIKEWTEMELVSSRSLGHRGTDTLISAVLAEIKVSVPWCPSDLAEL